MSSAQLKQFVRDQLELKNSVPDNGRPTVPEVVQPAMPARHTDLGNARRLVEKYGADLRFVPGWGWLSWDGRRWLIDDSGAVDRAAESVIVDLYHESAIRLANITAKLADAGTQPFDADKPNLLSDLDEARKRIAADLGWAHKCQDRSRLAAIVDRAKHQPEIVARSSDFDQDHFFLNCENGTLDLRTGQLQSHRRADRITKLADVTFDREARATRFEAFLERVTGGDQELAGFLQRAVGYSLTGDVGEHCLFFLHGGGRNGKSTFLGAVQHVLGDYASQAAPNLLMQGDRHPTELADLVGRRLVATIETEDGRAMAEVITKQLTGGDRVKARYMRQDFFEFHPSFKIWLAANHKPVVRGTDLAMWSRIHLVPFEVTIPPGERDRSLLEKLKAESAGILNWALEGCLVWQRAGLQVPERVRVATDEYRKDEDVLGSFLDECCVLNDLASVTAGQLLDAYKSFIGNERFSNVRFSRLLRDRGFVTAGKDPNGRAVFFGLGLRQDD